MPKVSRRLPRLTLVVFVLTLAVTAAMYLRWPELGPLLERDPKMLQGEWWRFVTTWFVLTDGWTQILINSLGLLVYGIATEREIGRGWWIVAYAVAGTAGEVAGIFWQPVGGGNSVAVCGLIGLHAVWRLGQTQLLPLNRFLETAVWGALGLWLFWSRDIHGAALVAGFAIGGVSWVLDGRHRRAVA